jgi:hypothetical protein
MRRLFWLWSAACAGLVLTAASGWTQPLGRSAEVHRSLGAVDQSVRDYFSPGSMHDFQIVSQSRTKAKAEIVARRAVRDKLKWTELAYCRVPAMQMLDTLQQGNITVRVKLERESSDRTYVTVVPAFEGVYEFAGNTNTRQCTSNGVLEKDILRAAGAPDTDLN